MSERASTAALAGGALVLFLVLMFGGRSGVVSIGEPVRPTTTAGGGNGYTTVRRWLESEAIRVVSLRERFAALERLAPAGAQRASLLVLTLPGAGPIQTAELLPLDRWLRAGNTLLVVAALADAPDWAQAAAGADAFDLKAVTGLDFARLAQPRGRLAAASGPARLLAAPARSAAVPVVGDRLLDGVATLVAESDYRNSPWAVRIPYDGAVLELARDRGNGTGVLWSRSLGRGRIVVAAYGSLLANRAIGLGDNGRFVANLVAAAVGPQGAVLFDDGHQGLSPTYDPQQLFGDRRLHLTIALLVALWLVWVLGATRLRTPRYALPAPRPADLLWAAGGFFARVLPAAGGARRLCEHFFVRLQARIDRSAVAAASAGRAPPWDWLERHPRVDPGAVRQLRAWYGAASEGRPVPLGRLHNLILSLDRQVA